MKRKITILLTVLMFLVQAQVLNVLAADSTTINPMKTLSGSVKLSSGQVAASGGFDITIKATNENNIEYQQVCKIAKGKNSVAYSMKVPTNSNFVVGYLINKEIKKYESNGYYNSKGTTVRKSEVENINVKNINVSGKNMTVLLKKIITGTVSLPSGQKAPVGGLKVEIQDEKYMRSHANPYMTNATVVIPEGKTSGVYKMYRTAVQSVYGGEYTEFTIRYKLEATSAYATEGYYSTSGTVDTSDKATVLDVSGKNIKTLSGINLKLITKK